GDDYDRYELKLHAKTGGLIKEWADAVLFANYEIVTRESGGRTKGISTGARLIHTERRAAWDAKNRYGLPESLPLSWDDFAAAVRSGSPATAEQLALEVHGLLAHVDEAARKLALEWLGKNGNAKDARALAQMADRLRAKMSTNTTTKEVST